MAISIAAVVGRHRRRAKIRAKRSRRPRPTSSWERLCRRAEHLANSGPGSVPASAAAALSQLVKIVAAREAGSTVTGWVCIE